MKPRAFIGFAFASLASLSLLTACGGGSDDQASNDPRPETQSDFVDWTNSVNGEVIHDANGDRFKVVGSSYCLYSVARNSTIINACSADRSNRILFKNAYLDVVLTRSERGNCMAVLVEASTGLMADLFIGTDGLFYGQSVNEKPLPC